MNKYFNFPYKELLAEDAWKDRASKIAPLNLYIGEKNIKLNRIPAKPVEQRRTEGIFDQKSNALTYPEVAEAWEKKGLHYHCTSMGICAWIAMIPTCHMGKTGYDDDMDLLLVFANADTSDPNWCMYTLERYNGLLETAAKEKFAVIFIVSDKLDVNNWYVYILQEAITIFKLNFNRFYLDVSTVYQDGGSLKDVPNFKYTDDDGNVIDADSAVMQYSALKIPVLNIVRRWENLDSLTHSLLWMNGYSNLAYDKYALFNSLQGKKFAEAISLEYLYDDAEDPSLMKHWDDMGLKCEFHDKNGEQWITFTPKQALEEPDKKLPCVCIFQEVNRYNPHQAVTAFSYCYQYMNIAAQGDCILLFFVLETLDDNDLLHDILDDAEKMYPIDRSRVYLTGHSHDGRFTAEYTRRHPEDIAAMATLGNEPGQLSPKYTSGFFAISDEQIERQAMFDIPTINISGDVERNSQFPLHSDAPNVRPGQWVCMDTFEKRAESWQRRLKSARCPMRTVEEIAATKYSDDYVERRLGFPCDKTECLYLDGSENYIGDIKNIDGKYHFRVVSLGNMPHTITPTMIDLSWSYMRRFARNRETLECIELY